MATTSATLRTQRGRTANELPQYEIMLSPLTLTGQGSMTQLCRSHHLIELKESLLAAQQMISVTAGELNDRVTLQAQAAKRPRLDDDLDGQQESTSAHFKSRVEGMTERMEGSMRKLVDGEHHTTFIQQSMTKTASNCHSNASTRTGTQSGGSQHLHAHSHNNNHHAQSQAESGSAPGSRFDPTDPSENMESPAALIETFRESLDQAHLRYQASSHTARYAENNKYLEFRRTVHDARFPNDEVPLSPPNRWFEEGSVPLPGDTGSVRKPRDQDHDDDVAISRTNISIKCPLTLQDFKEPLTSSKCPHSFESEAILDMIRRTTQRTESNLPVVQCPVSGCAEMLSRGDLHTDAVLVRKIRRIQQALQMSDGPIEHDQSTSMRNHRIEDLDDSMTIGDHSDATFRSQVQVPLKHE